MYTAIIVTRTNHGPYVSYGVERDGDEYVAMLESTPAQFKSVRLAMRAALEASALAECVDGMVIESVSVIRS